MSALFLFRVQFRQLQSWKGTLLIGPSIHDRETVKIPLEFLAKLLRLKKLKNHCSLMLACLKYLESNLHLFVLPVPNILHVMTSTLEINTNNHFYIRNIFDSRYRVSTSLIYFSLIIRQISLRRSVPKRQH